MYYDVAVCEVPEWFGLKRLKPVIIEAGSVSDLKKKSDSRGFIVLKHPKPLIFRKAVEKSLVDAVLPDRLKGHDYLHHKHTLLSNVTAKLMSKFKVSMLFTFRELLKSNHFERAIIWGRMKYEMSICLKKSVPIIIASGATKPEELVNYSTLLAFGELLGLEPIEAKKSLRFVHEKVLNRE